MKRRCLNLVGGVILGIITIGCVCKYYHKFISNETKRYQMILNIYEAYTIKNRTIELDTTAVRVLCIGNSITHHAPASTVPGADPYWKGDWGMCASKRDKDYQHILEEKLRFYNKNTKVDGINIACWERDFDLDKDSLLKCKCKNRNLIVLKVGENVKDESGYEHAYNDLVSYCLQFTPNVIVVGCYGNSPAKERAMITAACRYKVPYVPIFWIRDSYKDVVDPHVGDTIFDVKNNPYPILTDFICTHPNDEGMRMIAEAIMNAIEIRR